MLEGDGLHHTVFTAKRSSRGVVWCEHPVSRLEVHERKRKGLPIVQEDWGPDEEFLFHICKGDTIELLSEDGTRQIYVVRGVAERDIKVSQVWDPTTTRPKDKRITSPNTLRARNPIPVVVTPAGRVFARGK